MIDELEFDSEMDFEDEWFEEESLEEETYKELEQARGEVVIDAKKKRLKTSAQGITLSFEDTDSLDEGETYTINLTAETIKRGINEGENVNFKKVGIAQLKGNKFLEYITYQDEEFNPQLTMAFENGYSIEISGRVTIEEIKEKPKRKKKKK
jgi:Cu/Ag efflux protein CusF